MAVGPFLMGIGLLWFVRMPGDSVAWALDLGVARSLLPPMSYWRDVFPALTLFGIGIMVMVAPLTTALMRSVPVRNSGVASAFNNAISRVGPQLAGAVLFIAITSSFYAGLSDRVPGIDAGSTGLRARISPLNPVPPGTGAALRQAARGASTESFHLAVFVAALLCLVGAAVNAVGIRNQPAGTGLAVSSESDDAVSGPGKAT
jgi:hypothetical protein